MNTRAQFDAHPDAESLNAFAEQALGDREREEIMTHLAVCGRCRDVVFLAQEAAGLEMEIAEEHEEELVLAAAMPVAAVKAGPGRGKARTSRTQWYRNWWMMWIPVGALAVVVALATVMHVRHVEQNSEMAKNVQSVPLQTEGSELPPPAAPERNAGTKEVAAQQKPGAANRERQAEGKSAGESRALGIAAPPLPAAAPGTNQPVVGGNGDAFRAPEGLMASSRAEGRAAEEKAPAVLEKEQESPALAVPAHPSDAAAAPPPKASQTVVVNAEDQIVTTSAQAVPESAGSLKTMHSAMAGSYAMYRAKPILPSGFPAVSTATIGQVVLGVDKSGSVFLSGDAGVHWENIARQWDGRAVAVRTQEMSKKDEADKAAKQSAKFELVNDEGKVWVSSDGRTWTLK